MNWFHWRAPEIFRAMYQSARLDTSRETSSNAKDHRLFAHCEPMKTLINYLKKPSLNLCSRNSGSAASAHSLAKTPAIPMNNNQKTKALKLK